MRRASSLVLAIAATVAAGSVAEAQGLTVAQHARLRRAFDPATYRAVTTTIESAQSRGLPVAPLVDRAFQGSAMGAPGPKVRTAVASLAERLEIARAALAPDPSESEIAAGAVALGQGIPRETLTAIRQHSRGKSVTLALGVLTELVAKKVGVREASQMIVALLNKGATAAQLVSLSDDLAHDVDAGLDPAAAFDLRTRGVLGTLGAQGVAETDRLMPGAAPPPGSPPGTATNAPPRSGTPQRAPRRP